MKFKKLAAVLAAATMALTMVTAASADTFSDSENVYTAEIAEITSTTSTVSYDRLTKITPYTQTTGYSCATTCAGMCVHKSNQELKDAGFNINYADWYGIGNKYGYSVEWLGRSDINGTSDGLKKIYNYLKSGYLVCVWINQTNSHWVTVYSYTGDGMNFKASDFMCADPARCWSEKTRLRSLDTAVNYAGVYNTVVFK